jgi:Tol biopolymer transport system component
MKGVEFLPSFSPDGRTIYFSHGPGQQEIRKIYKLDLPDETPRQLTKGDGSDDRPVVSRDGRFIAYLHRTKAEPAELRLVPAEGGNFRTLRVGEIQSASFGTLPNILFTTEWIRPEDRGVIHRIDIETGEIETMPPPENMRGDIDVSLSPDGRTLAFVRYRMLENADLYLVSLDQKGRFSGSPKRVTSMDRRMFAPAWYPDGKRLLVAAGTLTNRTLWQVDLRGLEPKITELAGFGDQIESAAISSKGSIALVRNREDSDIWRFPLAAGGDQVTAAPSPVFASTALDEEPRWAPDGERVAFFSERSGSLQAWLANSLSATPKVLSQFERAEKAWLSWSPSGRLSVFARIPGSGPELHELQPGESKLRKVFSNSSKDRVVGISNDGESLYVTPEDRSIVRLERWWIRSGARELIAKVEAGFLRESEDGEWLYYARRLEAEGIFRMPRNGGPETRVVESLSRRNTFALRNGWLYYVSPTPRRALCGMRLRDGHVRELAPLDRVPGWGMDVSPDGRSLLLPLFEIDDADIFIADSLP